MCGGTGIAHVSAGSLARQPACGRAGVTYTASTAPNPGFGLYHEGLGPTGDRPGGWSLAPSSQDSPPAQAGPGVPEFLTRRQARRTWQGQTAGHEMETGVGELSLAGSTWGMGVRIPSSRGLPGQASVSSLQAALGRRGHSTGRGREDAVRTEPRDLPHAAAREPRLRTKASDPAGVLCRAHWLAGVGRRRPCLGGRKCRAAQAWVAPEAGPGQNWDTGLAELGAPPGALSARVTHRTHAGVGRQHVDVVFTQRVDDDGLAPAHQVGRKLENLQAGGRGQVPEADPSAIGP